MKPPFKQGDLDSLCGFYAAINAVSIAAELKDVSAEWIRQAAERIDRPGLFSRAFGPGESDGLRWSEVIMSANAFAEAALDQSRMYLQVMTADLDKVQSIDQPWNLIVSHLTISHASAVIGFRNNEIGHWSAVKSADSQAIHLADPVVVSKLVKKDVCLGLEENGYLPASGAKFALIASDILLVKAVRER